MQNYMIKQISFILQTLFRKNFALGLGAEHKRLEVKSETIKANSPEDEFLFENTDYFSVFGTLKLDTYDNKYFPKKDFILMVIYTYIFMHQDLIKILKNFR